MPWLPGREPMQPGFVEMPRFGFAKADIDAHALRAQLLDATASHFGKGIPHRHHHARKA